MYFSRNAIEGLGATLPFVGPTIPVIRTKVPIIGPAIPVIRTKVPIIGPTIPVIRTKVPIISPTIPVIRTKVPIKFLSFKRFPLWPTPLPFTPIPEKVPVKSPELDGGNFFQESFQIRRIILQHRKLKVLRSKAPLPSGLLERHGEFVKYMRAYLELYKNRLPADTLKEIESVVNDTSLATGQMSGLGFFPLLIFGLSAIAGTVITKMVTDTVKANIDKQESEIELNTKLVEQGKDPFAPKKEQGFFEQVTDILKVGALIGGGFLLLNLIKKRRSK